MTTVSPPNVPFIWAKYYGGPQTPKLIVLHSTITGTSNGNAHAVAEYFANENGEKTSAHYVVDSGTVIQCVPDHHEAWHCGWNRDSIGIEMCDMSTKNLARWFDPAHRAMMTRAVHLTARLCAAYDIPPWFVDAPTLQSRWENGEWIGPVGVTTHAQMSLAFHASDHTDPGTWPRYRFMKAVRNRVAYLEGK